MTSSSNFAQNTNQLPISLDVQPSEAEYQEILQQYLRRVANSVNTKSSGLFLLQETGNFEQWFGATPQQNRSAFRLTLDFVALNGGNIPTGTTPIVLSASTQPPEINGYLYPTYGYGGATDTAGISYFPSDPKITVTYTNSTDTFSIINNTGHELMQFYWVMNYLKN